MIIYFEGVSWLLTVLLSSHLFIRRAFLAFRIILQHRLDRRVSFFFRAEQRGFNFFIGPLTAQGNTLRNLGQALPGYSGNPRNQVTRRFWNHV